MAMLAEPRRKQKVINLRAKNNAWSNDSTKFGQRMLEKMGWTSGKGLGVNENGITEHVVARYKNDEKGLGFEDKNDQWTKHEDDFNALLANLSNASDNTENLHSGISLEDKSKKSKARIHYHKFTRGKDISQYSEKDLANIFGKKSFKSIEVTEEPLKDELKSTEQIFTAKGSMEDYFKNKLAEYKVKNKSNISNVCENDVECDEQDYTFCGFSQQTYIEIFNGLGYNREDKSSKYDAEKPDKKKKKSENLDNFSMCTSSKENSHDAHEQQDIHQNQKCIKEKIKKKRRKHMIQHADNDGELDQEQDCIEEIIQKKKSNNKHKHEDNDGQMQLLDSNGHDITIQSSGDRDQIFKKKKSKKKESNYSSQNTQINNFSGSESSKNKEFNEENFASPIMKKKKSKRKDAHDVEILTQNTAVEYLPKKKKKRKRKEN